MNPNIRALKYQLKPGWNTVEIHGQPSRNTHIADQGGTITLWVSSDVNQPVQAYQLYVALTGEEVPQAPIRGREMWYLGTCLQHGGGFVTHTYIQL